jgi:hypothetical protein
MRNLGAKVRPLAERQAGRVAWWQFIALGIEKHVISRWADRGYLHQVLPRVYAVGHRAPCVEADLWAAVLYAGPGAMLSHATALWWRGLIDNPPWPLQVATPRRCRSLTGIRVYGRRTCGRVPHKGLPTTTLEQALLDFAAVAPPERIRHVLANADYHQMLNIPTLQVIAGGSRKGSTKLRNAIRRHEPKYAHTRSWLERLFIPLCERAGIPLPDFNVELEGVLVDAVWREQRLVVELDGKDNHSSWAQIQNDRSKELRLRAGGFDVVRYGTRQVEDEPALVEADVLAQLRRRGLL